MLTQSKGKLYYLVYPNNVELYKVIYMQFYRGTMSSSVYHQIPFPEIKDNISTSVSSKTEYPPKNFSDFFQSTPLFSIHN